MNRPPPPSRSFKSRVRQSWQTLWDFLVFDSMKKKLALAISLVVVVGVSLVITISTSLGLKDANADARSTNQKLASSLSLAVRQVVEITNTRARSWVVQSKDNESLTKLIEGDSSIFGVQVIDVEKNELDLSAFQSAIDSTQSVLPVSHNEVSGIGVVGSGREILYQAVSIGAHRMHRMLTPLVVLDEKVIKVLVVFLDPSAYTSLFKLSDIEERFMFDGDSRLLMRSPSIVGSFFDGEASPKSMTSLLAKLKTATGSYEQELIRNEETHGDFYVGLSDTKAGIYVAVATPREKIVEKVRTVAWQSTYLGLALLSLALWFAIFFSDSIVKPLLALVEAAQQVSSGNFSARTQVTTRDELASLTRAFNSMAQGLAERERIKEVFGKFHSKGVIRRMLEEERLKLGGDKIPVTVFFSDIRSFTSTSENMQPEQVVEMLNEYMGEMVAVIDSFGGEVDKYVGDAIMAVWGLSRRDPKVEAEQSVLACIAMREKLNQLNVRRLARGSASIEIGMGLNSGDVVFGKIGSPSRMEYTVIGDTVNTASRTESLTKEHKTDLLINESTVKLLPRPEIFELVGPFRAAAKGKADGTIVYGCKGLKAEFQTLIELSNQQVSIDELKAA